MRVKDYLLTHVGCHNSKVSGTDMTDCLNSAHYHKGRVVVANCVVSAAWATHLANLIGTSDYYRLRT